MKAEIDQQRTLLTLAEVDAELRRIAHRAANLTEQQEVDRLQEQHQVANDQLAVVGIALEDLDGEITKLESEIESVRQREERDRGLLAGGTVNAKQLSELQHELETLERRQASLEDSLLEVMERREALQAQQSEHLARVDELQTELSAAQSARDKALAEINAAREGCGARRSSLAGALVPELLTIYEKQTERGGVGAAVLQGRRCGACRIEIDRGEMARITAAEPNDLLRCPECGAVLLRLKV